MQNGHVILPLGSYLMVSCVIFLLGMMLSAALFWMARGSEPEYSQIRRLKIERSDLKQEITELKEEIKELKGDLEVAEMTINFDKAIMRSVKR